MTLIRFVAMMALVAGGCQRSAVPAQNASAQPASTPIASVTQQSIREIEAGGRKGLWSSVMEVCRISRGERTLLSWNVTGDGVKRVVVSAVDLRGVERHFGQGDAIGERETGPWLRPGFIFKLRDHATSRELASVTIGEKHCR